MGRWTWHYLRFLFDVALAEYAASTNRVRMDGLKFWFSLLVISSGLLAILADDHDDIVALQSVVTQHGKQIESLDVKTGHTDSSVGTLTTVVDLHSKDLKQLRTDVATETTERMKVFMDLETTKEKWNIKAAEVEKKMGEDKENATKRMENLETMLQNQITLSSNQYKLMEEKWKNETERTGKLEQSLKSEEEKTAELEKKLKQQDEATSEMKQSLSDYEKKVEEVYDLLPNATFPNRTSIIHVKLNKLKVRVSEEEEDVKKLRVDVDSDSKKLSDTSTIVTSLRKSAAHTESDLGELSGKVKDMDAEHEKEHAKFHPNYKGFRFTGRGWSYNHIDQIYKRGIHLGDCLKFCAVKRGMDPRFNGVNYFDYPNGVKMCYCVKGAYGFNPMESAMQFLAD